ncbi:hypothetical protein CT0861_05792 [Colletotrichum tofieldiae]|uniref:Uncharacterized protein n=1 Tax=Colletotrichum tofieldiae TaxID=708197 RepID=A0A166W8W7_9PEZI|nr:hypothetical protein CT0861_05792 [Colletotrichum tofieldiae]
MTPTSQLYASTVRSIDIDESLTIVQPLVQQQQRPADLMDVKIEQQPRVRATRFTKRPNGLFRGGISSASHCSQASAQSLAAWSKCTPLIFIWTASSSRHTNGDTEMGYWRRLDRHLFVCRLPSPALMARGLASRISRIERSGPVEHHHQAMACARCSPEA